MFRYGREIRKLSSISWSSSSKIKWDPSVDLQLNHPSLILLEKCSSRNHFKQILGQIMRTNQIGETFPMSRILFFSAISHPDHLDFAILLFNHFTPRPNLYIYNTLILGFSFSSDQAFLFYNSMLQFGIYPDKQTLIYLLQSCRFVMEVKQIHCHSFITGLLCYEYLQNSLMKKYIENREMGVAHKVFDEMPSPDVVSYNIMIVNYAKNVDVWKALQLFKTMAESNLEADEFTILGLLICCGKLGEVKLGKSVHTWIEKKNSILNLILGNALLDMYVKCSEMKEARKIFTALNERDSISWNTMIAGYAKNGEMELSREVFDQAPRRDLVSWNSLISGYAQKGELITVQRLFSEMISENIRPDNITMANLIVAATEAGDSDRGRWIHGLLVKMEMKIDAILGSVLIDMYSKTGSIERAYVVFKQVTRKDVTIWTTMITGFAFHGHAKKALELFSKMQHPNEVTFVSVLAACNHSGLVDEGIEIFNKMKRIYDIEPGIEHYGCLIDLVGRSGQILKAVDVIESMPMKPSRTIWGALLSACEAHGNVEVGERASMELLKLEPERESGYVLLSNIYAKNGNWTGSNKVRKRMESKGVKKIAGCSQIRVDGIVHEFMASDKTHPKWIHICSTLHCLRNEMIRYFTGELDTLTL